MIKFRYHGRPFNVVYEDAGNFSRSDPLKSFGGTY